MLYGYLCRYFVCVVIVNGVTISLDSLGIINWAFTIPDILTLSLMVCKWVTSWNKFNNLNRALLFYIYP